MYATYPFRNWKHKPTKKNKHTHTQHETLFQPELPKAEKDEEEETTLQECFGFFFSLSISMLCAAITFTDDLFGIKSKPDELILQLQEADFNNENSSI